MASIQLAPGLEKYRFPEPIRVTRTRMPRLEDYSRKLEPVWESQWLTNDGELHRELCESLQTYLGVENLSLCCNGTIALLIALQAGRITSGEVITTPFTFPATPHALHWNQVRPVFCDIDEKTFNIDPDQIERHISAETRAILGVHVFGQPCEVEAIQAIAETHGLMVMYDAAHAMGVTYRDQSVMSFGDFSILSFHATKLFSTGEGGAIASSSRAQRERVDFLKNFGIADEETIIGPGINGKMNEFQAAFGLLQLEDLEREISDRKLLVEAYRKRLRAVPGISFQEDAPHVRHNYSYFPILVHEERFGMNRDNLVDALKQLNIFPRKYFYPLCSEYPCYSSLPSSDPENLPVARHVAARILCLPLYGSLGVDAVEIIAAAIAELHTAA